MADLPAGYSVVADEQIALDSLAGCQDHRDTLRCFTADRWRHWCVEAQIPHPGPIVGSGEEAAVQMFLQLAHRVPCLTASDATAEVEACGSLFSCCCLAEEQCRALGRRSLSLILMMRCCGGRHGSG